jgi:hypothetical protein
MSEAIFNRAANLESPAWSAAAVTPNNDADLARVPTRALWVGVLGNVSVVMAGGGTVTFVGVQGVLPIRVDRVRATDTTATSIVALY